MYETPALRIIVFCTAVNLITLMTPHPMPVFYRIWFILCLLPTRYIGLAQESASAGAGVPSIVLIPPDDPGRYRQSALARSAKALSRVNLFIFSQEKMPSAATLCFRFNTAIQSIFHRNIHTMRVGSLDELIQKVDRYMADHPDLMMGHVWLDAHGRYKKGYAYFSVGRDTIWTGNIRSDSIFTRLARLTAYCDGQSKVTLGACYSGADYVRPGNDRLEESPMRGDSLVQDMAGLFTLSPVYASKSWIMVKPFLFGRRWGISGFPRSSRYKDEIFKPAWERTGQWISVAPGSNAVVSAGTPFISRNGDIIFPENEYQSVGKHRRKIEKRMKKLRPSVYNMERK